MYQWMYSCTYTFIYIHIHVPIICMYIIGTWWRHWKTTCCCRFTAAWCLLFTCRGMSHVTRMNESCHMWKWVTWHPWMSRVTWHRIPTSQPSLSKQEKRKESTNLAVGDIPGGNKNRERGAQHLKTLSCRDNILCVTTYLPRGRISWNDLSIFLLHIPLRVEFACFTSSRIGKFPRQSMNFQPWHFD